MKRATRNQMWSPSTLMSYSTPGRPAISSLRRMKPFRIAQAELTGINLLGLFLDVLEQSLSADDAVRSSGTSFPIGIRRVGLCATTRSAIARRL